MTISGSVLVFGTDQRTLPPWLLQSLTGRRQLHQATAYMEKTWHCFHGPVRFLSEQEGVLFDAAILFGVLKRTCPAAYKHIKRQGVEPLMFATDWLMCLYSRHLPFNTLLRVWDLFFCNGEGCFFCRFYDMPLQRDRYATGRL